eukprot:364402-Chlamydomonas_euryale.AAC.7
MSPGGTAAGGCVAPWKYGSTGREGIGTGGTAGGKSMRCLLAVWRHGQGRGMERKGVLRGHECVACGWYGWCGYSRSIACSDCEAQLAWDKRRQGMLAVCVEGGRRGSRACRRCRDASRRCMFGVSGQQQAAHVG